MSLSGQEGNARQSSDRLATAGLASRRVRSRALRPSTGAVAARWLRLRLFLLRPPWTSSNWRRRRSDLQVSIISLQLVHHPEARALRGDSDRRNPRTRAISKHSSKRLSMWGNLRDPRLGPRRTTGVWLLRASDNQAFSVGRTLTNQPNLQARACPRPRLCRGQLRRSRRRPGSRIPRTDPSLTRLPSALPDR